jgi:mannitol-1-/sugar-/sorbitol-6-/2-deoxyglucose-6-phosphatase
LRIGAVVLDMDGLLIDTEPVWRTAEAEVFAELGVELTQADLFESTGPTIDEVVRAWLPRRALSAGPSAAGPPAAGLPAAGLPAVGPPAAGLPGPGPAEVAGWITDRVADHVSRAGVPMPGVPEAIALFRRAGLRLAIASSSPAHLIDAVCARLGLDIEIRCSALNEPRGKPAPDVYLAAARRLELSPDRCLAVEDSPAGVLSAKAADLTCLAVPDPLLAGDPRYGRADLVLASLTLLDEPLLRKLTT